MAILEMQTFGKVIGKNIERGILGAKYVIAFEAVVDGAKTSYIKTVGFNEYCSTNIGDTIPVTLFTGNGEIVTSSLAGAVYDSAFESLFGLFILK